MNTRHFSPVRVLALVLAAMWLAGTARATSNYEYGADEYVTISKGVSPDGKFAITTHGGGELGYDGFHVYLFDAAGGKKIGPLDEIAGTLDTGAGAFGARWREDSTEVTIIYRVDRHAPLKAMTYRLADGRAIATTPTPVDVKEGELTQFWNKHCTAPVPTERTFGTPKARP